MSYVMNVIKLFGGKNAHIIYKLKFIFYMWQKSPPTFSKSLMTFMTLMTSSDLMKNVAKRIHVFGILFVNRNEIFVPL